MSNLPSQGIAVDPSDSDHVLAAKDMIVESRDGGKTWEISWEMQAVFGQGISEEQVTAAAPVIAFAPSDPKNVYVGFGHENCLLYHEGECETTPVGIAISKDGGSSWQLSSDQQISQLNIFDIAVDQVNADHLYAATEAGLFSSTDNGESWQRVSDELAGKEIHAIAIDPNAHDELFVGVHRDGVYRSTDGGQSWQHMVAGLEPNGSVHDILFDPTNPTVVYASDIYSGVYRSTNSGGSWSRINNGLQSRAARSLAISADGQHIYVGTNEDGVLRLDLTGVPPERAGKTPGDSGTPVGSRPVLPCMSGVVPLGIVGAFFMWKCKIK